MFTQSCLIRKNTKELRDYLEKLGYKVNKLAETEAMSYGILCNKKVAIGLPDDSWEYNLDKYLKDNPDIIDCGTNQRLFLSICAIRNDTDKYQLFTNGDGDFFKCFENEFSHFKFDERLIEELLNPTDKSHFPILGKPIEPIDDTQDWHKATVRELIEHFKNK